MGASGKVSMVVDLRGTPATLPDLSTCYHLSKIPLSGDSQWSFMNGTGAGQLDQLYEKRWTALTGGVSIDLQSFSDPISGDTVGLSELKMVYLRNRGSVNVTVSGEAGEPPPWGTVANGDLVLTPTTDQVSAFLLLGEWTISHANGTILLKAASGTAEVDVILAGVRA